jgi:predicted dehydrogenase
MGNLTRRRFLGSAALASIPVIVPSSAFGETPPSERVNIGMIACGNITRSAETRYMRHPKAHVLAVCDPFEQKRMAKKKLVDKAIAEKKDASEYNGCLAYNDFRDLLANKDVDAVYIATGDYWHVPLSILAAKSGKDLHTEKPLGLCINECLQMEKSVKKHERVFQYGTEGRSMIGTRLGIEMVLNGHIGEIEKVYAWAPAGSSGGNFSPGAIPDGFDYDLWLGPAPEVPFSPGRCCKGGGSKAIFHYYDYAIGFIAGWGAHPIDIYQWWADNVGLGIPNQAEGTGRIPTDGVYNTITHWNVTYRYKKGPVIRFYDTVTASQELPKQKDVRFPFTKKMNHGVIFVGTKGQLHVQRGTFNTHPVELRKLGRDSGKIKLQASNCHEGNWVDRILDRKEPVSDIWSAVRSDIICHLGDIAIRTGRKINWDDEKKTIVGDKTAEAMMCRKLRKPWTLDI